MKTEFRTYCGLAGDLQELLLATSEMNVTVSKLIPRIGWFKNYLKRKATRTLLKELELLTGQKHVANG